MELQQGRSHVLAYYLFHRQDEFANVSLRGSASDKQIVLHHSTYYDLADLTLNVMGTSMGCGAARMMMGWGGGCAVWLDISVWIERLTAAGWVVGWLIG